MSEDLDLSYSSDFEGMEDAYLGEGGVNFSAEADSDSDLENMFADLAAAQDLSEADSEHSEGGAKKRRRRKASPKRKRKAKSKSRSKKRATKKKATRRGGAKKKASKKKAAKKKPAKKPKNDSEFIHYTMVTESGKEVGDYRVRRGKQGPSAAAAKAATRHINDHKLKNKSSGNFTVKIRQTTRGTGYNKIFTYKVDFKKEKASAAFKKMTGRDTVIKKKLTAA